jgi:hypothetical protein
MSGRFNAVQAERGGHRRHRSGRDDRVLELHGLLAAGYELHAERVGVFD